MELYSLHTMNGQAGLIEEVKVCLDENVDSTALALLNDTDTLKVDEIIRSKVEDAARLVHERAAHHLLDSGVDLGISDQQITRVGDWVNDYVAAVGPLPEDFLRLVTFRLQGWAYPVTDVITEESPLYMMQSSRFGGVRGNPERPVVALTHQGDTMSLELYSCSPNVAPHIQKATYIPVPEVNAEGKILLCPKLKRAVVYRIASMTAAIIGASEQAAMLLGQSNELAGIVES